MSAVSIHEQKLSSRDLGLSKEICHKQICYLKACNWETSSVVFKPQKNPEGPARGAGGLFDICMFGIHPRLSSL